MPTVPSLDDCVPRTSVFYYTENIYSTGVVVYCDAEDFYAAEELPDYVAADYSASPLACIGPDCPVPQYASYESPYEFQERLEDAESRYRAPGEDQLPALFRGELGGSSSVARAAILTTT